MMRAHCLAASVIAGIFASAALAEPMVEPHCSQTAENGVDQYMYVNSFPGGFVVALLRVPGGYEEVQLIACENNVLIKVSDTSPVFDAYDAWLQMDGLTASTTQYTFDQIAEIFRIQGHDAEIASFSDAPCVCEN